MCYAIPFTFEESLERISQNPVSATARLYKAMENQKASDYITKCMKQFRKGIFGITPLEDVKSNMDALEDGEGRIIARYEGGRLLEDDIYIIAPFSFDEPGVDCNYTTLLYCNEY